MIEEQLKKAKNGRDFWINLTEYREKSGKILYLLFCGEDEQLERLALAGLESLRSKKKADKIVILTCQQEGFSSECHSFVENVFISQEIKENVLCFYELYQFTEDLLILSFQRPWGTKLSNLLKKGYSKEEILKQCIFA